MSLKNPHEKMSKSHQDPNSRILVTDSPEQIHGKVKGALTDSIEGISYDPKERPGVSNLIEILKHVTNADATCEEIAADHATQSMRVFKEHVANEIIKSLPGVRDRFLEFTGPKRGQLDDMIGQSTHLARATAGTELLKIEILIGLKVLRKRKSLRVWQRQTGRPSSASKNRKKEMMKQNQMLFLSRRMVWMYRLRAEIQDVIARTIQHMYNTF